MGIAQIRDGDTLFLCRVGGVAVHDGHVLLHRSEHDDFWALPGGRMEVGETIEQTLKREMLEELDAVVEVGPLLWLVENFFEWRPADLPPDTTSLLAHHELGFYLQMEMPHHLTSQTSFVGVEAAGTRHQFALEYRWFKRSEIDNVDVRPTPFTELLTRPLPKSATRIVNVG